MIGSEAGRGQSLPWERHPHRLWSLWDMIKIDAVAYINLGERLADANVTFELDDYVQKDKHGQVTLTDKGKAALADDLDALLKICEQLSLPVSKALISKRLGDPPHNERELGVLIDAVKTELDKQLFTFIPSHLTKYYECDDLVGDAAKKAFPTASAEIREAGTALAAGLHTATVFHSMRAVEIGLQKMAAELGVTFNYPIELAEWGKIVGELEPKINAFKAGERSPEKDANLKFYSEAAAQFRHFNNAWRVRVSHARASYKEQQAIEVIEHARSFFETLAERLKE
jgi:alpha-D-ribose 1-methylphosphonate 5-triphosphate synthase subunit PhnG